jgi:putative addiction module killer protein
VQFYDGHGGRRSLAGLPLCVDIDSFLDDDTCLYEIRHYVTREGRDLFDGWLRRVRNARALGAIDRRLVRVGAGNFGDHKYCSDGVWELRVDVGAGYRVYYALETGRVVLLLVGGDKSMQAADIKRAAECLRDWKERTDAR